MMVIYHSAGIGARLAAAVHLGLLPEAPPDSITELSRAWEMVGDPEPGFPLPDGEDPSCQLPASDHPAATTLRLAGELDGVRVFTLGRRTSAEVVERAFGGMADIFGLDRKRVLLVSVETGLLPAVERTGGLLCRWGADRAALSLSLWSLRYSWKPAAMAVKRVRRRIVN